MSRCRAVFLHGNGCPECEGWSGCQEPEGHSTHDTEHDRRWHLVSWQCAGGCMGGLVGGPDPDLRCEECTALDDQADEVMAVVAFHGWVRGEGWSDP